MKTIMKNGMEYFLQKDGKINILFFTAKNDLNFNYNSNIGIDNLNRVKEEFKLHSIFYLNQVHGKEFVWYDGSNNIIYGDAIITTKRNHGIGVFTADCVPVIIYSNKHNIISVVHSGWKGTLLGITGHVIDEIVNKTQIDSSDLSIYIGAHNRSCCYEVSKEVFDQFENSNLYKNHQDIYIDELNKTHLNLEKCIIFDANSKGVKDIKTLNLCTYCSDEALYSYRKKDTGRLFSMVYIDNQ